jgi:putative endonuclease
MYTVYILKNSLSQRDYIGSTNNIARRLEEHNRGQTKSTRQKGNWTIMYSEVVKTRIEATKREKLIKSYKGGNAFKKLIER